MGIIIIKSIRNLNWDIRHCYGCDIIITLNLTLGGQTGSHSVK